jgi:hypothetical protein
MRNGPGVRGLTGPLPNSPSTQQRCSPSRQLVSSSLSYTPKDIKDEATRDTKKSA